ncbi:MAG: 4Fe-4S binding protein [Clostridia bacterium]
MSVLKKNATALIECMEEIPCDPCVAACKAGAIAKSCLTACPTIDEKKCTGCKVCVAACSGQAIFLQDTSYKPGFATISFPYEYRPLPIKGQLVTATDRFGASVCQAEVLEVQENKAFNKTAVITLKIPINYAETIRFMQRLAKGE